MTRPYRTYRDPHTGATVNLYNVRELVAAYRQRVPQRRLEDHVRDMLKARS